jgi:hypothetical protein
MCQRRMQGRPAELDARGLAVLVGKVCWRRSKTEPRPVKTRSAPTHMGVSHEVDMATLLPHLPTGCRRLHWLLLPARRGLSRS